MDRCPNCGSSVRIGAKFCTTCGFRLPSEAPAAPAAAPSRSPFDTTSTASVSSRWPTPEPAPVAPPAPEPSPVPEIAEAEAPIPQTAELMPPSATPVEDAAAFTGWPAYGSGFGSRPGWNEEQSAETESPLPADLTGESDVKSVEDAIFAWTGTPPETEPAAPAESNEADSPAVADNDAESSSDSLAWFESIEPENNPVDESTMPEQVAETIENAHSEEYEAFLGEFEQTASDTPPVDSELTPVEVESVDGDSTGEPAVVDTSALANAPVAASAVAVAASGAISGDPAERAAALIDELKVLLPRLGGSSATAGLNVDEIVAELTSARTSSEEEKANMQSLRAAIATAQARPRDLDVMLDLVSRSGEIAALFMAHDAYAEAIDRAVEKLKGEFKPEPAPRW